MNDMVRMYERPQNQNNYMIAGWEQWADAGENSSGLPAYLIEQLGARRIAELRCDDCYLFQLPGSHHLMRPEVKLKNGHCLSMAEHRNELWYTHIDDKGLLIFLGEEPHLHEKAYADAFLDLCDAANARRVVSVGGVYGAMPFEKEREISCSYSLPRLRQELSRYAVHFSDYEGGATIGNYLVYQAELRGIEMIDMNAFSPAYEFNRMGITVQAMRVEQDWKSWYDLMRRIDYMFGLGLDLSDLEQRAQALIDAWVAKVEELDTKHSELGVKAYLESIAADFVERPFVPLDQAWSELDDLFDDDDEPGD
ncbi:MAG: PAC2 family protein [Anaerolineales bacterium]